MTAWLTSRSQTQLIVITGMFYGLGLMNYYEGTRLGIAV